MSSQGRRGVGIRPSIEACDTVRTTRPMSFSTWSPEAEARGIFHRVTIPKSSSSTSMGGAGGSAGVRAPGNADWNGISRPGPIFATPLPGFAGSMEAATGLPNTSVESCSSFMRSATRRFVFARRLSLITPAGRCGGHSGSPRFSNSMRSLTPLALNRCSR